MTRGDTDRSTHAQDKLHDIQVPAPEVTGAPGEVSHVRFVSILGRECHSTLVRRAETIRPRFKGRSIVFLKGLRMGHAKPCPNGNVDDVPGGTKLSARKDMLANEFCKHDVLMIYGYASTRETREGWHND